MPVKPGNGIGVLPPPQKMPLPQRHTVWSLFSAKLESDCAPIAMTFDNAATGTASSRRVVVPSPSCPDELSPHAQTVPSLFNASECPTPAATRVNTPATAARTGRVRPTRDAVALPVPSCPESSSPQPHTLPSKRTAKVCERAAISATPEIVVSATGASWVLVVPSPICPWKLSPHANNVPSARKPTLWLRPPATLRKIGANNCAVRTTAAASAMPAPQRAGVQSACEPSATVLAGNGRAVFSKVPLSSSGVKRGFADSARLATPETCAAAMLVPLIGA